MHLLHAIQRMRRYPCPSAHRLSDQRPRQAQGSFARRRDRCIRLRNCLDKAHFGAVQDCAAPQSRDWSKIAIACAIGTLYDPRIMFSEEKARIGINERNVLRREAGLPLLSIENELERWRKVADRATFKPHAIILTERRCPQPIFVAAFVGVDRLLRIDCDLAAPRASFVRQSLNGISGKVGTDGKITAFGFPVGFVVNYAANRAIRFDLEGCALELLPKAYCPGRADLSVHGRRVPDGLVAPGAT
jgi:hypothetical protein